MKRTAVVLTALLCLTGLCLGCSSTMMQGTPFYTSPSRAPEGKAPDRVNLWPLVYYQHPVLSVLLAARQVRQRPASQPHLPRLLGLARDGARLLPSSASGLV